MAFSEARHEASEPFEKLLLLLDVSEGGPGQTVPHSQHQVPGRDGSTLSAHGGAARQRRRHPAGQQGSTLR